MWMSGTRSFDVLGPVDHLIVEFPAGAVDELSFAGLLDLVDRGLIYVLDLEFVERPVQGEPRMIEFAAVAEGKALAVLAGASSGLLDDDDLRTVAESLAPGTVAAVVIFENLWIVPMLAALHQSGGRIVSENRVSVEDLLRALDRVEGSAARSEA
jgi:hypothetical protein